AEGIDLFFNAGGTTCETGMQVVSEGHETDFRYGRPRAPALAVFRCVSVSACAAITGVSLPNTVKSDKYGRGPMSPKTLYAKIWDAHLVHEAEDGTCLLYIDRHLVHEVT